ncbi:MAG: ABC transporter permease [Chloroflexi bacterium]|nr:ABC transporter permease [Chloroflexota bacterium]
MMLRTRWRKVGLDLWSNKVRTLLVVAAIAVGVFSVGLVATGQHILLRELNRDYLSSQPASATLYTSPVDEEMIKGIAAMPQVAAAEGRRSLRVQAQVGPNQWRDLLLTAVPDFQTSQLDIITPVDGQWPPRKQELLVEALSLDFLRAELGDTLLVELADGTHKELELVGSAHDSHVPNAQITNNAFGYVTPETMESLAMGRFYTEVRFTVTENSNDKTHIQAVADAVKDKLEKSGREVYSMRVPNPGEHWAQEVIETLVLLIGVFGVLILFLSGFLVINTISALLSQHTRQIGVMKLVGARRRQIMAMYMVTVLAYGLMALLVGMPLGIGFAQYLIKDFVSGLLNFQVASLQVPASILLLQVAVGLLVPLLAALWPVLNGVQVTTHKALNSLGISQGYNKGLVERWFTAFQEWLPVQRPLIISLRNTVRRKGRLALTLTTLILGTALFIAVLSVRDSVQATVDSFLRFHQYDVRLNFDRPHRLAQIEQIAWQTPGVVAVEGWTTASAQRVRPDGTDSDAISLQAAPVDSALMDPPLEDGRWLQPTDRYAIVVNTDFMADEQDVQLGEMVTLTMNGRENNWQVVGVVRSTAAGPGVYVSDSDYAYITRSIGQANSVRVVIAQHDLKSQEDTAVLLSTSFQNAGLRIAGSRTTEEIRQQADFQFNIVVGFLVMMAGLLAMVGGLGLTTTMSINVLERIREIGVLRAIGASDGSVRLIVMAEGVLIGWLSFAGGSLLAVPFSRILSQQVGVALLGFPLDYTFSVSGMVLWFVIISILGAAASLGPARNASRLTIREVLAYE